MEIRKTTFYISGVTKKVSIDLKKKRLVCEQVEISRAFGEWWVPLISVWWDF